MKAGGCEANRTGVATNAGDAAVDEKRLGGTRPEETEDGGRHAHQSHSSFMLKRSSSAMSSAMSMSGVLIGEHGDCMANWL